MVMLQKQQNNQRRQPFKPPWRLLGPMRLIIFPHDGSPAHELITSEFEAQSGAWTGFARVSAFYDGVLMDDGSFERGEKR